MIPPAPFFRKNLIIPFIEKISPLLFFEKNLITPFFRKISSPLFFEKKKHSSCRLFSPGYPINFDPSLENKLSLTHSYLHRTLIPLTHTHTGSNGFSTSIILHQYNVGTTSVNDRNSTPKFSYVVSATNYRRL